jgi:hypothetical protein
LKYPALSSGRRLLSDAAQWLGEQFPDLIFQSTRIATKQVAPMITRRSLFLTLAVGALCLAGCATVSPARGNYALIPITKVNSSSIHVESAYLAEISDQLTVIGWVRMLHRNSVGSIHVDITFLGVQGKQIATKTATIRFSHSRIGAPPAAQFYLPVEAWPEGTTEIVVSPHFGRHNK